MLEQQEPTAYTENVVRSLSKETAVKFAPNEEGVRIAIFSKFYILDNFAGMRSFCYRPVVFAIKFARTADIRTASAPHATNPRSAFAWICRGHGAT
jgi:hypothetical protein